MRVGGLSSLQVVLFQALERRAPTGPRKLGVGIFARLVRVYHGTEDDVRAIGGEGKKELSTQGFTEENQPKIKAF